MSPGCYWNIKIYIQSAQRVITRSWMKLISERNK
jgi:hypothetical protein